MLKLSTVARQLAAAGLPVEWQQRTNTDGDPVDALRVSHDYSGMYPDRAALRAADVAEAIAARAGRQAWTPYACTATIIY